MFIVFENLRVFENRFEELNMKLYDPATAAQRELYASLMKEHKELEPIVETYRAYCRCQEDLAGAKELLEESGQRELREMAQQEIKEKGEELSRLEEELKLLLLPKDPNDEKTSSWRSGEVPAGKRQPCLPIPCTGCIPCTLRKRVGKQRSLA